MLDTFLGTKHKYILTKKTQILPVWSVVSTWKSQATGKSQNVLEVVRKHCPTRVVQLVELRPLHQKVASWVPNQGIYLGFGSIPGWGN